MQVSDERRTFFRIHDNLSMEFRRISEEDFRQLRDSNHCEPCATLDWLSDLPITSIQELKGRRDELFSYLQLINKKLDTVIKLLSKTQEGPQFFSITADINISGAGVQFETTEAFQEGDFAEIKITIPLFPYPRVWALCQVVRAQQPSSDSIDTRCVAMKFLVIDERDRDVIINYVFAKERENLRHNKEAKVR